MTERMETDAEEFNSLQKLGLELESPQDEFSYQPDSGGTANGAIGKLEYGIDIDLDAQGREIAEDGSSVTTVDYSIPIPGESEWSQKNRLPVEELGDYSAPKEDQLLAPMIKERLTEHPVLKHVPISVTVRGGAVILSGDVHDDATKLMFRDAISDLPGITTFTNNLTINTF